MPNEFLERTLQAGETVIGEYDYFYMDKNMYSSDVRAINHHVLYNSNDTVNICLDLLVWNIHLWYLFHLLRPL